MRICFLHIGPHKTGSSSIQQYLRANEGNLLEHDIQYVTLGGKKKFNTLAFVAPELNRIQLSNQQSELWDEFTEMLANDRTLLISDERLSNQVSHPDFLPELVALFAKFERKLVLLTVHREQVGHLNSAYVQGVKRFIVKTDIEAYIGAQITSVRYSPMKMKNLADAAGVELRPISFEHAIRHSSLGAEFVKSLGVDPVGFAQPQASAANPNPGALTILAAERVRAAWPAIPSAPENSDPYKIFRRFFTKKGWEQDPYFGISPELQRKIYDEFFEENDAFVRAFLGKTWTDTAPFGVRTTNVRLYEALSEPDRDDVDLIVNRMLRQRESESTTG